MTQDLFIPIKPKSMEQRIKKFAREKGFFSSVDLERFKDDIKAREGLVKGLMRIHRTARGLTEKRIFRRLDNQEKVFRGFDKKYATYEYVREER